MIRILEFSESLFESFFSFLKKVFDKRFFALHNSSLGWTRYL